MRRIKIVLGIILALILSNSAKADISFDDLFKGGKKVEGHELLPTNIESKNITSISLTGENLKNLVQNILYALIRTQLIRYGTQIKKGTLERFIKLFDTLKLPENQIDATIFYGTPAKKVALDGNKVLSDTKKSLTFDHWIKFLKYYDSKEPKLEGASYYNYNPVFVFNEWEPEQNKINSLIEKYKTFKADNPNALKNLTDDVDNVINLKDADLLISFLRDGISRLDTKYAADSGMANNLNTTFTSAQILTLIQNIKVFKKNLETINKIDYGTFDQTKVAENTSIIENLPTVALQDARITKLNESKELVEQKESLAKEKAEREASDKLKQKFINLEENLKNLKNKLSLLKGKLAGIKTALQKK